MDEVIRRVVEAADSGGVVAEIRAVLPSLKPSEARVGRFVIENSTEVIHLSVGDMGAAAEVSPSTVVRSCQRLGFRGFQHLKIALAGELGAARIPVQGSGYGEQGDEGSPGEVLRGVLESGAKALRDSLSTMGDKEFGEAVTAIRDADKVLFVGVGTSAPLAQDAAYRFLTIGVDAQAPPDVHTQHVAARLLKDSDVCFAVSHTGSTTETVASVRAAREAGARVVAVTSFSRSPLTERADVVLVAGGPEESYRLEAMTSRIAHLSILDALFVAVAGQTRERAGTALDAYADVISEHRY